MVAKIPRLESFVENNILFIAWNVSERMTQFLRDMCSTCTIVQRCITTEGINGWQSESNCTWVTHPIKQPDEVRLEKSYDEIIFISQTPFPRKENFLLLQELSSNFREQSNFYLVSDHDNYEEIGATFPEPARFHFSRDFCFFGEPIVDQIKKVPALKGRVDPTVLLLTFNFDKTTTSRINESFREYTTRHVDLMPWSLDSLSFRGSEIGRVAIVASEVTDWASRETISVLYTALSRAKQKAMLMWHDDEMRSLLSLSPVDQIFNKLRSSDKL